MYVWKNGANDMLDAYTYTKAYNAPDYYTRRHYGKYTIYNKEGWRVAHGLNKKEMENYMKLLKKEEN